MKQKIALYQLACWHLLILMTLWQSTAFTTPSSMPYSYEHSSLQESDAASSLDTFEDALFLERFKRRRYEIASLKSEQTPKQLIKELLSTLLTPHHPSLNWGYETLYSQSTEKWRYVLRTSVGASNSTEDDLIYQALATSMERYGQQFGILVGLGVDDGSKTNNNAKSSKEETYTLVDTTIEREMDQYAIEFPYDTLDYHDGTAWVECRLRNRATDALLVVIGWSLQQVDGVWKIDGIDWQDFRDKYRPGIGREEWERICG